MQQQADFERGIAEAINAYNRGQVDVAASTCRRLLQMNPAHPALLQLLAVILLKQGQPAEARIVTTASLHGRPEHVPSLLTAGQAARAENDLSAARCYYENAAMLAPHEVEPAYLLGQVLLELGDAQAAVTVFKKLTALAPGQANLWCRLGAACRELGEHLAADNALRRALQIDPKRVDAWFNLGLIRQDLRDFPGAAEAFRNALAYRPGFAAAALNLAIVLQEAGLLDAAMSAYREAYRLDAMTFGRIAHALTAAPSGRLWLDTEALRTLLSP